MPTSLYDQNKLAAALAAQGAGADGRTILNGNNLLSIFNPIAAPEYSAPYSDDVYGDVAYGAGYDPDTGFDSNGTQYTKKGDDGYTTTISHPGYFVSSNGTSLPLIDGAQFGDPGGQYFTDNYNNPSGNGDKDQAFVTYKVVGNQAIPVSAQNVYNPSTWVDQGREELGIAAGLATGGALGAAYGGAGAALEGGAEAAGGLGLDDAAFGTVGSAAGDAGATSTLGSAAITTPTLDAGAFSSLPTLNGVGAADAGAASAGAGAVGTSAGSAGGATAAASGATGGSGLGSASTFGSGAYDFGGGSGITFGSASANPSLYDGALNLGGAASGSSGGFLDALGNYVSSPSGLKTIGGLGSALLGSNASSNAANAAANSVNSANALQKYIYDTNRSDNAPALQTRNNALSGLNALMANPSSITSDPGYQFELGQGQAAIDRSAASKGGLYSGATLKALDRYGTDYGTTKLNDSYNRLLGVAGVGNAATASNTSSGTNYANQSGNNTTSLGSLNAGLALNQGNLYSNLLNGAVSAYTNYKP